MGKKIQLWEFALWFSVQIARFLTKNSKWLFTLFLKTSDESKRATERKSGRAKERKSLRAKEQKSERAKDRKSKRAKEQIPNPA